MVLRDVTNEIYRHLFSPVHTSSAAHDFSTLNINVLNGKLSLQISPNFDAMNEIKKHNFQTTYEKEDVTFSNSTSCKTPRNTKSDTHNTTSALAMPIVTRAPNLTIIFAALTESSGTATSCDLCRLHLYLYLLTDHN